MRALTSVEIVSLWEEGDNQPHTERVLRILTTALPRRSQAYLAALPASRRNDLLLALRMRMFGDVLSMESGCPRCGDKITFELQTDQLMAQDEIVVSLECPNCAGQWIASLDIGDFLWREISALAKRLLDDVSSLAARYGWREADILAMSEKRRAHYRSLVGDGQS